MSGLVAKVMPAVAMEISQSNSESREIVSEYFAVIGADARTDEVKAFTCA